MSLSTEQTFFSLPLWRLAFRPFFLLATIFSVVAISWWAVYWWSPFEWQPYGGPIWWHGHEMLFGFVAAIVVGFLLTAVKNWTGVAGINGPLLIALAACWLLGRLLIAFGSHLPVAVVIGGDNLFLPAAAAAMAYPVIKVRQWRNLVFVPILLVLALLNALSHWALFMDRAPLAITALHGAIMLFVLVVTIIGGRVIPLFTANKLGINKSPVNKWLELFSIAPLIVLLVLAVQGFANASQAVMLPLCGVALVAHSWRFSRWGVQHCRHIPLLWSLHLSYAFIPVGLLALLLYSAGYLADQSVALHCFTVGALGSMILAMISRVTLGHTGRAMQLPKWMALAFVLVLVSALLRVIIPTGAPQWSHWGVAGAAVSWVTAYGIFVYYYSPMLLSARADGRPG